MIDGHEGMVEEYPGSGITHDCSDLFPVLGSIAMDFAVGAEGLRLHEGTVSDSGKSIIFQILTLRTKVFSFAVMVMMAIERYHLDQDSLLLLSLLGYLFLVSWFHDLVS